MPHICKPVICPGPCPFSSMCQVPGISLHSLVWSPRGSRTCPTVCWRIASASCPDSVLCLADAQVAQCPDARHLEHDCSFLSKGQPLPFSPWFSLDVSWVAPFLLDLTCDCRSLPLSALVLSITFLSFFSPAPSLPIPSMSQPRLLLNLCPLWVPVLKG